MTPFCCSYNAQQVTKFRAFWFVIGIRLGQCVASYALVRINPSALLDWCDSPIAKNMKIAYMEKMIGIDSSLRRVGLAATGLLVQSLEACVEGVTGAGLRDIDPLAEVPRGPQ